MFHPEFSGQDRQHQSDLPHSPDPDQGNVLPLVPELSVTERFEAFHAANPHVYATLVRLARRYHEATGETKQSVQRVVEIARWDEKIRTHGDGSFEINNDFRAFYSRLIMWQEIDLRGHFELRRAPEADAWIAALRGDDEVAA